jgi:hypothetical protein
MIEKMTLGQLRTLSRNLACRLEIQHGRDLVPVLGNGMERNNREALQTWLNVKSDLLMEATEQLLAELILEELASAQENEQIRPHRPELDSPLARLL